MLKNIIFDMGGVLIDIDRRACVEAFKKIGFNDIEQYIDEYVQAEFFLKLEDGRIGEEEFYDLVREKIGDAAVSNDAIRNAWFAFLLSIPEEKLAFVKRLKRNYKVYLLSNTNPIHFPYVVEHMFCKGEGEQITDFFDTCFLSYELKLAKPSEAIFRHLTEQCGINPKESLFIDDGERNVAVAASLGFNTYHAKPFESFENLERVIDSYRAE